MRWGWEDARKNADLGQGWTVALVTEHLGGGAVESVHRVARLECKEKVPLPEECGSC